MCPELEASTNENRELWEKGPLRRSVATEVLGSISCSAARENVYVGKEKTKEAARKTRNAYSNVESAVVGEGNQTCLSRFHKR